MCQWAQYRIMEDDNFLWNRIWKQVVNWKQKIKTTNVITNRNENSKTIWKQGIKSFKILHLISIVFENSQAHKVNIPECTHTHTYTYLCGNFYMQLYVCMCGRSEMKIVLHCADVCVCVRVPKSFHLLTNERWNSRKNNRRKVVKTQSRYKSILDL